MNAERLKKLQALSNEVRIGGKGTPRRKKKVIHQTPSTDDKKLQSVLKKIGVNQIPSIEEVNMFKNDGTVIHFNNPKTQASLAANTFTVIGNGVKKEIAELLPNILTQLGPESVQHLRRLASDVVASRKLAEDDEVPELIENFEETAKKDIENLTQKTEEVTVA